MTEHERVVAEYRAWCKTEEGQTTDSIGDIFAAGWLAAKNDTKRLHSEAAIATPQELPTFDEWFVARNGHALRRVPGTMVSDYMLNLSANLRLYVSEMVKRR